MTRFRTHYDSLEVSRTASPEVITAAYRSLSKIYHPDLNRGDARCVRIMGLINAAYAVLSDPLERREYDHWIMRREAALANRSRVAPAKVRRPARRSQLRRGQSNMPAKDSSRLRTLRTILVRAKREWGEALAMLILGFAVVGGITTLVTRAPETQPKLQMEAVEQTAEIMRDEDLLFGDMVAEEACNSTPSNQARPGC